MENKQTAVEWLEQKISSFIRYDFNKAYEENEEVSRIFNQAKQMEKEQIINAFGEKRQFMGFGDNDTFGITEKTGQEYYNETYGK